MSPSGHPVKNVAASVRQRLLDLARRSGEDYNALLVRYASERLLYRLTRSPHADRFVLKGAWLFYVWEMPRRATRDVDFLGYGDASPDALREVFREVAGMPVEPDGVAFDPASVDAEAIRGGAPYPGVRVRMDAHVGSAEIVARVDVGFGDATVVDPERVALPTLLEFPAPELRVYAPATVVAEKLEAVVRFGVVNTRLKDYFDLLVLAGERAFEGAVLAEQITATFTRRGTAVPDDVPTGLTDAFAGDPDRRRQWRAFLRRSQGRGAPDDLGQAVALVREFVLPPLTAASEGRVLEARWEPGRGWIE
jgi:predicted nucleotidyltransferase component of viral defense system